MYKITLGDAMPMIGSFGIHLDYTVRLKLRLRDKIDCERAQKRIAAQKDEAYYRLHCDAVMENAASEQEFAALAAEMLIRERQEIQRRKTNG